MFSASSPALMRKVKQVMKASEEKTHDPAVEFNPDLTGRSIARLPRTHVEVWLQRKRILDFSTHTLKLMLHADPKFPYKVLCRAETIDMVQSIGPMLKSQWDEVYSQRFTCMQRIEPMRNLELDSAYNILWGKCGHYSFYDPLPLGMNEAEHKYLGVTFKGCQCRSTRTLS